MVQTKEVWAAALTGGSMPLMDNALPEDRTPSAMLARMEKADAAFHSVLTSVRMTRQGFPAAKHRAGTSLVTTLPAPMVVPAPTFTPGIIKAPPPIQTSSPMAMGSACVT